MFPFPLFLPAGLASAPHSPSCQLCCTHGQTGLCSIIPRLSPMLLSLLSVVRSRNAARPHSLQGTSVQECSGPWPGKYGKQERKGSKSPLILHLKILAPNSLWFGSKKEGLIFLCPNISLACYMFHSGASSCHHVNLHNTCVLWPFQPVHTWYKLPPAVSQAALVGLSFPHV